MFKNLFRKNKKAFTLIELLLVIGIIALLTSLILVLLSGARAQGRDSKRKAETDSLRKALALYYADYGTYPTTTGWVSIEDTSDAEVNSLRSKLQPYLPVPPSDPIFGTEKSAGVPYSYQYMSTTTDSGEIAYKLHAELETGTFASYETYSSGGEGIVYGGGGVPWACGDNITVTHIAGAIAPVTKTVTYGTVQTSLSGASKCWITQNLGATNQATAVNDGTEASAGWYWQFNRQQGFKHDGTTRTPATTWIVSIDETSDWTTANDPCALLLGMGWRIPTSAEWTTADSGWTTWAGPWGSGLYLHAAGFFYNNGALDYRGVYGDYWSSTQYNATRSHHLDFGSIRSLMSVVYKADGFNVRCLKD